MSPAYRYANLPRMVIFAHRGSSAHAPENTLAAFHMAAEQRADAIEFDVMMCASGEVVVIHDRTVDRTTNGMGEVSALSLSQLKQFDAGVKFSPDFTGERIPSLKDVFEEFSDEIFMNIELKNNLIDKDILLQSVAALITRYHQEKNVIISSFDLDALGRIKKILPRAARAGLADEGVNGAWVYSWSLNHLERFEAIHPDARDVTPRLIHVAHDRRQRVHPYTVNDPRKMRQLVALGVDGFFTNDPLLARQVLEEEVPAG